MNKNDVSKSEKTVVNIKESTIKKKIYHSFQDISKIEWVDIPDTHKNQNTDFEISPVEIIDDELLSENIDSSIDEIKADEIVDDSNYLSYLSSDSRDNWVGDKH